MTDPTEPTEPAECADCPCWGCDVCDPGAPPAPELPDCDWYTSCNKCGFPVAFCGTLEEATAFVCAACLEVSDG